jgi:exonuclease III
MSLISWNCWGLGNQQTVHELWQLVKEKKPTFLFLMETKIQQHKLNFVKIKIGFSGVFTVNPIGRSGGLALLWRDDKEVEIQNYSARHINAIISMDGGAVHWKFTGFYGHPEKEKRHESFALLKHLKIFLPSPRLCVGDFNEIVQQLEKYGAALRSERQMAIFREALEEGQLCDLGF